MGGTRNSHDSVGHNGTDSKDPGVPEDPKLAMEGQQKASSRRTLRTVHVVLLALQLGYAGHQVLSRVALTSGLSQFVYTIYRNGIALVLMGPFAYGLEKKDRPPLTPKLLFNSFSSVSLATFPLGIDLHVGHICCYNAKRHSMFTFLLALMLRIEKVRPRRLDGKAKVFGTLVCVSGAVLMSVWKGPALFNGWDLEDREENDLKLKNILGHTLGSHALRLGVDLYRLGGICLLANCISWAAYFIMLGVVSSGINLSLQSWAIQRGGPLLVSLYTPLQTIIVAILSVLLLGDSYYVGSLIGGIGTVAGLYLVTWGQVEHRKQDALEAAGLACGDVESACEDPQSPYSSAASDLTHPLLAEGDYSEEDQEDHSIAIPSGLKRRPSFYDSDGHPGSFTPHYIH